MSGDGGLHREQIRIAEDVISTLSRRAALDVEGVAGIARRFPASVRKAVGRPSGIQVSEREDGVDIDIHIAARHGYNLKTIAGQVQEAVKREVSGVTEINVGRINVFVDELVTSEAT